MSIPPIAAGVTVRPLTLERWGDLERLFGPRGACGGCWCMWWHQTQQEFERHKGAGNRRALRRRLQAGEVPGLLAYLEAQPVGWCALAPRPEYSRLQRSRVLKPVDDQPVWSLVCFFVERAHRRRNLTGRLITAAVEYVRSRGGRILEAYPLDPGRPQTPDAFAWTGFASAFRRAGFVEVARRSPTRPVLRYVVRD